jgi:hypothetical protein
MLAALRNERKIVPPQSPFSTEHEVRFSVFCYMQFSNELGTLLKRCKGCLVKAKISVLVYYGFTLHVNPPLAEMKQIYAVNFF